MQIGTKDLAAAVKAGLISTTQATQLNEFWQHSRADIPTFKMTHLLYYFGGFLAIAAITLFVTQAWNMLVGLPLFFLSLCLFAFGLGLTHYFLQKNLKLPAGIMATFSLVVVPLAVYNIQSWLGYFPKTVFDYPDYHSYVSWVWMPMEITTLIAGVIMFYFYRFPFLLFPIAVTLWYISMDCYTLLMPLADSWTQRQIFTMYFGLAMLIVAFYMDLKYSDEKHDYAFWLYLFGVITFWGGLSSMNSNSEFSKFFYFLINLFMIFLSVFLRRRVFAIFGGLGILGYLGHLSFSVFKGSLAFPIALVFIGVLIIIAATKWAKVEKRLFETFRPYIPRAILERQEKE